MAKRGRTTTDLLPIEKTRSGRPYNTGVPLATNSYGKRGDGLPTAGSTYPMATTRRYRVKFLGRPPIPYLMHPWTLLQRREKAGLLSQARGLPYACDRIQACSTATLDRGHTMEMQLYFCPQENQLFLP